MSQPKATQAVVKNAILAAQACGVIVGEIIVGSDGTVKIVAESVARGYEKKEQPSGW